MNKKVVAITSVINLVLISISMLMDLLALFGKEADLYVRADAMFSILAIGAAANYIFSGYVKGEGKNLRYFLGAVALSQFVLTIRVAKFDPVSVALMAACLVIAVVLTVGKDLGKKVSLLLCACYLAIKAFAAVFCIIGLPESFGLKAGDVEYLTQVRSIVEILVAVIILICMIGKYMDKASRGRN